MIGFLGVVMLVGGNLGRSVARAELFPHVAVLSAAICYAISMNFTRKYLSTKPAVAQTTMMLLFSNLIIWSAMPLVGHPLRMPVQLTTWTALVFLGLLSSSAGYYLYFDLINAWGATRASLVNYVFPIIGLFLGVTFLGETITLGIVSGSFLVVIGVLLSSGSSLRWMLAYRSTRDSAPKRS
jgi:drug/metabolite transporter (DMT)-like permease